MEIAAHLGEHPAVFSRYDSGSFTRTVTLITVFYDGSCGLCHRAVRFLLARDPDGAHFRYAPLQGRAAADLLGIQTEPFTSMVVRDASGRLLTRGNAAMLLGKTLGGGWWLLATAGHLMPRCVRDLLYNFIAQRRYRWFGRVDEACPILPPDQREFFLD